MRSTHIVVVSLVGLCLLFAGCSSNPSPSNSQVVKVNESGKIELPKDDASFTFENPFEPPSDDAAEGSGIVGRWLFVIPGDVPMVTRPWLLEFSGTGEAYDGKVVDQAVKIETGISGLKKSDDRVTFNLLINEKPCPFDGTLVDGRIQGTLISRGEVTIAWLERTKLKNMNGAAVTGPAPGAAEFDAAQRLDDPKQRVKQLLQFSDKFATSTLAFEALQIVLRNSKAAEFSEDDVRAVTGKYLELARPWGTRWTANAVESIAYNLATSEAHPAVALEFAEQAKAALPEDATGNRKQSVHVSLAVALLNNDRAAESKELLDAIRNQDGGDSELRFYSALVSDKLGDAEGAVDTLIGLWPHPLATRELERIWNAKHGNLAGLETRLDAEYLKRAPPLAVEPYAGRPDEAAGRVAVAELFTGTSCPPCVAADLAFEALGRAFKRDDLVLLQYHLHVPGPDPLTNGDSESRANYYSVPGTPVLFVNGKVIAPVGGGRRESENRYNVFRGVVEKELRRNSGLKLELAATRDGDAIAIEANVSDVVQSGEKKLRLRLAIVEEGVRFSGLNGMRLHHAVVRAMPGGADGLPVTEATLKHKTAVSVAELKASIAEGMASVEKQFAFEFPAKPLELERLGVAAFVQDDATLEVLQSAFVSLAAPVKPETPEAEQKPAGGTKDFDNSTTSR